MPETIKKLIDAFENHKNDCGNGKLEEGSKLPWSHLCQNWLAYLKES